MKQKITALLIGLGVVVGIYLHQLPPAPSVDPYNIKRVINEYYGKELTERSHMYQTLEASTEGYFFYAARFYDEERVWLPGEMDALTRDIVCGHLREAVNKGFVVEVRLRGRGGSVSYYSLKYCE